MSATDKIMNVAQDTKGKVEETAGKVTGNERQKPKARQTRLARTSSKQAGEKVKDALKD